MRAVSLVLLAVLAAPLSAQELWVDAATGDDRNPGSPTQPLKSVTAALVAAGPATTVFVRGGIYSATATGEQFPLALGVNTLHDDVVLSGLGQPTLDFAGSAGSGLDIGVLANRARVTGLTFANMDRNDWWARAINAGSFNGGGSSTDVEIDRCRFVRVNRGIILWQGQPITGWRIHSNLFLDLGNDGINEFDNGSRNEIANNTFVNSPHIGVLSDADATKVRNNILTGLRVGIASSGAPGAANTRILANDFWNNGADVEGAAFPSGVPAGNLSLDPLFANATGGDYRLQASSPLIDAGHPGVFTRADPDMNPGAVDSDVNGSIVPDVGAYERTPVTSTGSGTSGGTMTLQVSTNHVLLPIALVVFALDDGYFRVPGVVDVLLDPITLIPEGFVGSAPYSATVPLPTLPPGVRIVFQGFGYDPGANRLIGGNQVRLQF